MENDDGETGATFFDEETCIPDLHEFAHPSIVGRDLPAKVAARRDRLGGRMAVACPECAGLVHSGIATEAFWGLELK
jgi:hypothetical protein